MKTQARILRPVCHISDLDVGDIIRHEASGLAYVVTDTHGDTVTAARTVLVTNPREWRVLRPQEPRK